MRLEMYLRSNDIGKFRFFYDFGIGAALVLSQVAAGEEELSG